MRIALIALLLSGCASLGPDDAQVRLSEVEGIVESLGQSVGLTGKGCVLTVIGELPPGVVAMMQQGGCAAVIGRE